LAAEGRALRAAWQAQSQGEGKGKASRDDSTRAPGQEDVALQMRQVSIDDEVKLIDLEREVRWNFIEQRNAHVFSLRLVSNPGAECTASCDISSQQTGWGACSIPPPFTQEALKA
jgi:hypothetical protein